MNRCTVVAVLLTAVLAVSFWAGSRVPQLNEKALMGGDVELNSLGSRYSNPNRPRRPGNGRGFSSLWSIW